MVISNSQIMARSYKNVAFFTLVASTAIIAVTTRLWQMTGALWYDEAFSAWLAALPIDRLIDATAGDVHPPAYYLILAVITYTLGNAEWVLRLPSLVAGLALIGVVWRLGRALGLPPLVVQTATVLCAVAPWQIYYSTEARSYALLTLAVAVAALGLVERRYWLAIVGSVAALYLHNLAAVFVGALWLAAFHGSARWWLAGITAAGLAIPALVWTAMQTVGLHSGYWIPPITPGRVLAAFDDLVFFAPNNPFVFATALLTGIALMLVLADVRRQNKFLLIAVGLPVLFLALFSLWTPVFQSRSIAPVAPFYYLLLADTIHRSNRRLLLGLGGGLVIVAIVAAQFGPLGRASADTEMMSLYGQEQPGDALYHANVGSYVVWQYYRPELPQYLWPQHTTLESTLSDQTREAMGMAELSWEYNHCAEINGVYPRWWFIYFNNPVTSIAEREMVGKMVFNAVWSRSLRNDPTTEAALMRVAVECAR
jgi:hypothetical protein